jgi:hypothetical protein
VARLNNCIILILLSFSFLAAQEKKAPINIEVKVVDSLTSKPLTYAQIFLPSNKKGTITNLDGFFKINALDQKEILRISFIGYKTLFIPAKNLIDVNLLRLQPKTELLGAVSILADNSFLYELVLKSKRTQAKKSLEAKTYLEIESSVNNEPIELVEGYYNGEFTGYNSGELKQKNGRIALTQKDSSYFYSSETSKAIYQHDLHKGSPYFPISPLELGKKKLNNLYDLRLHRKFKNDRKQIVYAIDFHPKTLRHLAFTGRVWIDSSSADIQKVTLDIKNAYHYPLIPVHATDSIKNMSMHISKSFEYINGMPYVKTIDFDYSLDYKRMSGYEFRVATQSVLFAYDYESTFHLPKFDFPVVMYQDYWNIVAVPYNDFFWKNKTEFNYDYQIDLHQNFDIHNVNSKARTSQEDSCRYNFFSPPFYAWSPKRILFYSDTARVDDSHTVNLSEENEKRPNDPIIYSNFKQFESDKYHLEIQLYLDYNLYRDSLHILTKTILDPFKSRFDMPRDSLTAAFVNVYFDYMELLRREMHEALTKAQSIQNIELIYKSEKKRIAALARKAILEMHHGTQRENTEKYNQLIIDKLNIDNLKLFNVYQD